MTEIRERLKKLVAAHAGNEEIQSIYAKCCALVNWKSIHRND